MISPSALIQKFQYALDNHWGYIYGKTHEMWTAEKQAEYRRDYESNPTKYADRKISAEIGDKWIGHYVTDCSGLFSWAFKELGGQMYHGSNTMYNDWCVSQGKLKNGKRTDGKELKPGTAVFTGDEKKHNHVGLYVGDGTVIEAQGTNAGVTTTKITNSKWTYWGELKGVNYGMANTNLEPDIPVPNRGQAVVTGTKVALRKGPTTSADVILRVSTGQVVTIKTPPSDWEYVEYNGKAGYMMKKYLKE